MNKGMKSIFIVVGLMMVTILLVSACAKPAVTPAPKPAAPAASPAAKPAPAAPTPQYGGILKRHVVSGPTTPIGWPVEGTPTSTDPVSQVCLERMLFEDAQGNYIPWLATEYKIADDKKSITFSLRKGVKFHDGTDFNAQAVKFNLDAYITAKSATAASWDSVAVVDDYTVRLNLKDYRNTALYGVGGVLMVSPAAYNKNGLEWARWNPVGTGPFKFVSFQRDVVVKFAKFDGYWQKGKPYLDGIDVVIIPDLVTALAAFKTGEIHTIQSESPKMSFDLKSEGYIIKSQMPHLTGTLTLSPDSVNADSPLSNKLVRQAIEHAIDRDAITKGTGFGFSMPVFQVSPPNSLGYLADLPVRKYSVETAKKLLAEAGFPNGFKTKVIADPRTTTRDVMVALQSYLNTAGIQTDLDFPDNAKYTDMRYASWKGGMMCQLFSNFATYQNYFSFYWAGNQFKSTKYPEGFREAWTDMLTTPVVQKDKVQKLNKMMYDDSMVIPICNSAASQGIGKNVHDTGLFEQHHSLWSPSTAWLEKGVGVK